MTKETLDTFGYNVLTAKDGAEARTIFEESKDKVDAVLVDMIMPVMEGPQCMHALREIKPEVKIILTSGLDEHQELCDGDDACTFLAKPYTADQLLSTLHNVLTEAH